MRACALLLVAVAAAWVPAASPSAGASPGECRNEFGPPAQGVRGAKASDLDLGFRVGTQGREITWILSLHNRTSERLLLRFSGGQYGNVVVRHNGSVVYSWQLGEKFIALKMYRTLAPEATYTCYLDPEQFDLGSPGPGRYRITAYLNTSPPAVASRSISIIDD
jgi:Intracellular proteinase inhibitor